MVSFPKTNYEDISIYAMFALPSFNVIRCREKIITGRYSAERFVCTLLRVGITLMLMVHLPEGSMVVVSGNVRANNTYLDPPVVIVVNANSPGSMDIGEYYAHHRGIPDDHICFLDVSATEIIERDEYNLMESQVRDFLLDNDLMNSTRFIVTTKGVPLKVNGTNAIEPFFDFHGNCSSVDSELALIFSQLESGNNGQHVNPYMNASECFDPDNYEGIFLVNRLTGPTFEDAKALVDRALHAEALGMDVTGKGYFDADTAMGGGFDYYNRVIRNSFSVVRNKEFDAGFENTSKDIGSPGALYTPDSFPSLPPADQTATDALFYWGWYRHPDEYIDTFEWAPGAVGQKLHSYNALSFNTNSWCAGAVGDGITGTMGNVYEPFLDGAHYPDVFFDRLLRGFTFAEAAYMSQPFLSWQSVVVGDPLYTPFPSPIPKVITPRDGWYLSAGQIITMEYTECTGIDIEEAHYFFRNDDGTFLIEDSDPGIPGVQWDTYNISQGDEVNVWVVVWDENGGSGTSTVNTICFCLNEHPEPCALIIPTHHGWNLISMGVRMDGLDGTYRASDLSQDINQQAGDDIVKYVVRFDRGTGEFMEFVVDTATGNDFTISFGEGYYVYSTSPFTTDFVMVGDCPDGEGLDLAECWDLMGWLSSNEMNVGEFARSLDLHAGWPVVQAVVRYEHGNGEYDPWYPGMPDDLFRMELGAAYWIFSAASVHDYRFP